jgi:hypothetical protein
MISMSHLGRLQGVGDHDLHRVVPADDVDALPVNLVDDVLDAAAADADAGADAIDLHVDGADRDLGAVAGLAGDRLDLDGPVGDLRDLLLEERADEVRVAARQDDFDPVPVAADVHDDGLDAVADVRRLAGDRLAAGQDRLDGGAGVLAVLAQGDDRGAGVHALDGAGHHLPLLGGELGVDPLALRLAHLLDHHLLGRLGGDAAEQFRLDELVALLSNDGAGLAVDVDEDVVLLARLALHRQLHRVLDGSEDQLLRDVLLPVDQFHAPQQVRPVHRVFSRKTVVIRPRFAPATCRSRGRRSGIAPADSRNEKRPFGGPDGRRLLAPFRGRIAATTGHPTRSARAFASFGSWVTVVIVIPGPPRSKCNPRDIPPADRVKNPGRGGGSAGIRGAPGPKDSRL